MCLSCGCQRPFDDHQDPRNIVWADIEAAATAADLTPDAVMSNLRTGGERVLNNVIPAALAFLEDFNRPDLAFDIDGVLAFFMECTLASLNAKFGTRYAITQVLNYWMEDWLPPDQAAWLGDLFANPAFYTNLAPDYAAIAALQGFKAAGFHVIVTSDRPAEMQPVTAAWLQRFEVDYDVLVLHGRQSKKEVVEAHGPDRPLYFFDDDPRKVGWLPKPGVELWLPVRPWTPDGVDQVENVHSFDAWDKVRATLNQRSVIPVPMLDAPAVKMAQPELTPEQVYERYVNELQARRPERHRKSRSRRPYRLTPPI